MLLRTLSQAAPDASSADGTRRATLSSLSLGLGFESWGGHSGIRPMRLPRAKQTNDVPTLGIHISSRNIIKNNNGTVEHY